MARDYDSEKQAIINSLLAKGVNKYDAEKISQDQINAAKQGNTAMEGVTDDEASLSAQRGAMAKFQEKADSGFTAADRQALNQSAQKTSQADNSRRLAILSEMQQRGQSGGGSELAARLAGADSAANVAANESQQIAARGEASRDAAVSDSANLAGQMRNQDYQRQSALAQARDGVSRFNADLQGRATMQNNQSTNQANQYNTGSQNQFDQNATQIQYNSVVEAQNAAAQREAARKAKKSGVGAAIGGIAGAAIGTYIAPGAGTAVGASAGSALGSAMFAHGGEVKGPEIVEGDDEKNDIIPITASAGEIIIPKSHATPEKAKQFVAEEIGEDEPSIEETVLAIAKALASLKGR